VAGGGALGGGVLGHRSARSGRSVCRRSCYGSAGRGGGRTAARRGRRRPRVCASDPGQAGLGLGMLCGPDGPELYGSCTRHACLLLLFTSSCSCTFALVLNLSGLDLAAPLGLLGQDLTGLCVGGTGEIPAGVSGTDAATPVGVVLPPWRASWFPPLHSPSSARGNPRTSLLARAAAAS
jgi:hypothetical protein